MALRVWLAALAAAGFGACAALAGAPDQALRLTIPVDPETLDPAPIQSGYAAGVARQVFSTLTRFDAELKMKGDAAESWEVSADGRVCTFHLKPGVRFHNGREMTAEDVAYTLARLARMRTWLARPIEGVDDVAEGKTERLKGVSTPDSRTVVIRLDKPFAPFLCQLASVNAGIVPREEVERRGKEFAWRPVGSGPFRVAEWRRRSAIRLEAFEAYHGGKPRLPALSFRVTREGAVAFEAYKADELDVCAAPREYLEIVRKGPLAKELRVTTNLVTAYLGITMDRSPLGQNVHLRRAMNYAINRPFLFERMLGGADLPAKGVLPPGTPGYDPELAGYEYDPAKAAAEMRAAGYGPGRPEPTVKLVFAPMRNGRQIAEQVQSDLGKIGIKVQLRQMDFAALRESTERGEPDLFRIAWVADYPDPDNFLYVLFHSSQKPVEGNRSRLKDPQVDKLLDAARAERDEQKRLDLYRQAERAIVDLAPWVFLSHNRTHFLVKPRVKGLELGPMDDDSALQGADLAKVWLEGK